MILYITHILYSTLSLSLKRSHWLLIRRKKRCGHVPTSDLAACSVAIKTAVCDARVTSVPVTCKLAVLKMAKLQITAWWQICHIYIIYAVKESRLKLWAPVCALLRMAGCKCKSIYLNSISAKFPCCPKWSIIDYCTPVMLLMSRRNS